ncbi:alpha-mannosidase [Mucisphaera calidilacus]|uniref:Mannosylglycerate hydrolase n=1 Tax=Mucisphaera calidilacus TaxID=2527982 RepID=A0A518BUM2_9BACT|nr:glycoside hydrolase family 38 C-terminal domain-containing protein [Mucisphaera calidilacus]QDU70624.1 Mannosylglycerate hydrolase [Mucisphaera calidilacus]
MGVKTPPKPIAWPTYTPQRLSSSAQKAALYVLSSHWDREWYQTFETFRYRLVNLLDDVLARQDSGEIDGPFYCDGQAIILEDYLDIRPDERQRIAARLQNRQLVAGPWYVLPDEFLVSGESLIRNIQIGRELVESLGGRPSDCGFLCDLFGSNAQMPQLLKAFGIEVAYVWRGTNHHDQRLLWWVGADGTRIPSYRFGTNGYWGYAVNVRGHCDHEDHIEAEKTLPERFWEYVEKEAAATPIDAVLVFDGADHAGFDPHAYSQLKALAGSEHGHDYDICHVELDDHAAEILRHTDRITTEVHGELYESAKHPFDLDQQALVGGTLASRIHIKQFNARCEWLLTRWAEPAATLATCRLGDRYPADFLKRAWKHLIQNHPHDSICGCSIDRVHEDMIYRFNQCEDLAEQVTQNALRHLAEAAVGSPGVPEDETRIVVFNPLPETLSAVVDVDALIPDWKQPPNGGQPAKERGLPATPHDEQGNPIPFQARSLSPITLQLETHKHRAPRSYEARTLGLSMPLELPPLGWKTISLRKANVHWIRTPRSESLVHDERTLQNQHLTLNVQSDGTLSLTDRKTNATYNRLLTLEDGADVGDGWRYIAPANDTVSYTGGNCTGITVLDDGPHLGRIEIRCQLIVPARYDRETAERSQRTVTIDVTHRVALRADARHVEVETTINNTAEDHRLRVLCPVEARTDHYWTDAPFDTARRPIALKPDQHTWREPELETKPQQAWTAVADANRGLALVAEGLRETAVLDRPDRAIALTLLRATQKTAFTSGEPGGQLPGEHTFRYWITPAEEKPDAAELHNLATLLNARVRSVSLLPGIHARGSGYPVGPDTSPTAPGIAITGPARLSALQVRGDELEIRLFNPLDTPASGTIQLPEPQKNPGQPPAARSVSLTGTTLEPIDVEQGRIAIELSPKQIITLRVTGLIQNPVHSN